MAAGDTYKRVRTYPPMALNEGSASGTFPHGLLGRNRRDAFSFRAHRGHPKALNQPDPAWQAAYAAAHTLIEDGQVHAARLSLERLMVRSNLWQRPQIYELLVRCLFLIGTPQQLDAALGAALTGYQDARDVMGMGRIHQTMGELNYLRGKNAVAGRELRYAAELFERRDYIAGAAMAWLSVVRVALRSLNGQEAQHACHKAMSLARRPQAPRHLEVRALLLEAQILAGLGQTHDIAKNLLWAERLAIGLSQTHALVLLRAETLLASSFSRRAQALLAPRRDELKDALGPLEAPNVERLLGQALLYDEPGAALVCLNAASQSFLRLGFMAPHFECALFVAQAEHRLGREMKSRLEALGHKVSRWPSLVHLHKRVVDQAHHVPTHAVGAVSVPWMRTMGQVHIAQNSAQSRHKTGVKGAYEGDGPKADASADPGKRRWTKRFVGLLQS